MKKETCGYLDGGHVQGPGTETSDSIHARLSNGEFVVKAAVVKEPGVLEFLKQLNSEKIYPLKFNEGGLAQIGDKFKQFVNAGKVEQIYDNTDGSKLANAGQTPIINPVAPTNTMYPDQHSTSTASAPIPGINPTVLQERWARIQAERDPLKQAQMKQQLFEQIRNIQGQGSAPEMQTAGFKDGGEVKSFNWDDHPVVEAADSQPSFDWSAHPEVALPQRTLASIADAQLLKEQNNIPEISGLEAAAKGATQGLTFNLADEIAAPLMAGASMATGLENSPKIPGESTIDRFKRLTELAKQTVDERQQGAEEQHPALYTAGQLAGAIGSPGLGTVKALNAVKGIPGLAGLAAKTAVGAGTGAALGGLSSLGEAQGSLTERLPEAKEGTQTGAMIGGAIPLAGATLRGAGKTLGSLAENLGLTPVTEAFQQGAKGTSLITEKARKEATGLTRQKSKELFNDIKGLQKDVGSKIQSEIETAEKSGSKVDLSTDVPIILEKLQKIKTSGSQEAAAYATSVEKEIKKVLGMKTTDETFMGVASKDLPEGLITPKAIETDLSQVDPTKAQDLKQVLANYTPRNGMAPQEIEAAGTAKELRTATTGKLNNLTENLPELNQQYGSIKDALKRLGVKENALPNQIRDRINKIVSRLENKNLSGDDARAILDDVKNTLSQIDPSVAEKYGPELEEIVKRASLADQIIKGGQSFSLAGTPKALAMRGANLAGLVANKTGVATATNFTKEILKNPVTQKTLAQSDVAKEVVEPVVNVGRATIGQEPLKGKDSYKFQRKVAEAAEKAEPDFLKQQAGQIREKEGNQGEQLAQILEKMADQGKDSRRALMFTVLQNPAYRKMLGMIGNE